MPSDFNKEASWLYAVLFVNDETLKNVNDKELNLAICHVTLSLSQSEGLILSSLSDLGRNRETSPKKTFKEHSCRTALLKMRVNRIKSFVKFLFPQKSSYSYRWKACSVRNKLGRRVR